MDERYNDRHYDAANDNDPSFADDLLEGAKAIALFMYKRAGKKEQRKIFHLHEKTNFPTFTIGAKICARKSVVLAWVKEREERAKTRVAG